MTAPTIYDSLVGYWKFDALNGSGEVPDKANQEFNGVLTDASLDVSGLFGSGLRTDLATGKMSVADFLNQRQSPTTRVSVNVWVNLDKGLSTMWGDPAFLDKMNGAASGYFLGVLPGGGNTVSFRVHNSAGTAYTASYTESATSGWVMITGVYEGSTVRIYRNGVSQNTAAADGTLKFNPVDIVVGLGFEGVIDELSLWMRQLSAGDVTALYNSGSGLELVIPESFAFQDALLPSSQADPAYVLVEDEVDDLPADVDEDLIEIGGLYFSIGNEALQMQAVDSPYKVVDSPRRIFVDPNPVILSVSIDSEYNITGVANAGPTDAATVTTWWQIEIEPDMIFIVAERNIGAEFQTNHDQTDEWFVPAGQNWRNLKVSFWMQANEDATQMWSSDTVTLTDPLYDRSGFTPTPLPPGPALGPARGPTRGVPGPGVYRPRIVDNSRGRLR